MTYLIVDHLRLPDLQRMDTTGDTPEEAQRLAAEMAQQYGCRVYVLGAWTIATAASRKSGGYVAWAKMGPIVGRDPIDEPGAHVWFQFGRTRAEAAALLRAELGLPTRGGVA